METPRRHSRPKERKKFLRISLWIFSVFSVVKFFVSACDADDSGMADLLSSCGSFGGLGRALTTRFLGPSSPQRDSQPTVEAILTATNGWLNGLADSNFLGPGF